MTDIGLILSGLNFLGLGGVAYFLYYLVKGLNQRIATLKDLAVEQAKTLEVVRERATEMGELSKSYKKAFFDHAKMSGKLDERRNELVTELEAANKRKDEELAAYTKVKIEELDLQQQSLKRMPDIQHRLEVVVAELQSQMRILGAGSSQPLVSGHWLIDGSFAPQPQTFVIPFPEQDDGITYFTEEDPYNVLPRTENAPSIEPPKRKSSSTDPKPPPTDTDDGSDTE